MKTIALVFSLIFVLCSATALITFSLPYLVDFISYLTNNSMAIRSDIVSTLNKYGYISVCIGIGSLVELLITQMNDVPITRDRPMTRF